MKPNSKYTVSLVLALLLGLLSGCATLQPHSAKGIGDAQLAFNRASMTYNQLKMLELQDKKPHPSSLEELRFSAESDYKLALSLVDNLLEDPTQSQALKADRLRPTALVLKTLALWKLASFETAIPRYSALYSDAIDAAEAAQKEVGEQERDAALMASMKGLANSDFAAKLWREREAQKLRDASLDCDAPAATYGCVRNALRDSVGILVDHLTSGGESDAPEAIHPFLATYLAASLNTWYQLISLRPLNADSTEAFRTARTRDIQDFNDALKRLREIALLNGNPRNGYELVADAINPARLDFL